MINNTHTKFISVLLVSLIFVSVFSFSVSAKDVWNCSKGDIFEFGSYPQTKVEDAQLLLKLNSCELNWISYDYYSGTGKWYDGKMESSDFMKYADVDFDGNASHYYNTNYVLNGIRPALKLDIKALVLKTQVKAENIVVYYKNTNALETEIKEIEGVEYTAEYLSSDEKVAIVDENGNVTAKGRGTAEITCILTDEYGNVTEDTCTVEVKLFWWQWIIYIVLFGWIWY